MIRGMELSDHCVDVGCGIQGGEDLLILFRFAGHGFKRIVARPARV